MICGESADDFDQGGITGKIINSANTGHNCRDD